MLLTSARAMLARIPLPGRPRRRAWAIAALALLVLACLMDATWWRPVIQAYIEHRSGRAVNFDNLDLGMNRQGQVVVTFHGLQVQNAPWARPEPLVKAAELEMSFAWRSVWADRFVISRLRLVDAQVDLERRSDGLRNWRLTRPEDRGPGRVRVQALQAVRTQAHIVDGALDLDLSLVSRPLPESGVTPQGDLGDAKPVAAGSAAMPAPPAAHHVSLNGRRRGTPFTAEVDVGDWLSLIGTGQRFSLRGELATPQARLTAEGVAGDLMDESVYHGRWSVEGKGVGELAAVLGPTGAATALPWRLPVKALGDLDKQGARWRLSGLQASLGRSDLAGELSLEQAASRPGDPPEAPPLQRLVATLRSELLDTTELRQSAPGGERSVAGGGAGLQAELDWQVKRLVGLPPADWEAVTAHVTVRGRRATLSPLQFTVWGGVAKGRIQVDASSPPLSLSAALKLPGVPLSRLADGRMAAQGVAGELALELDLSSRGETGQALAGALRGDVTGRLQRATLPAGLEAKLGLDGGRWLRSLVAGDERLPVTCSAFALQFEQGIGQVRQLSLQTPHLTVSGQGRVDLPARRYELLLAPRRQAPALLALDRWLHLQGSGGRWQVATVAPSGAAPSGTCAAPG